MSVSDSQLWRLLQQRKRLFLIAGPCVIESEDLCYDIAKKMSNWCQRLGITFVFKASFDKANRSSGKSFRGPGIEEGLTLLSRLGKRLSLPVLTDIHTAEQAEIAAGHCQILQIPAFLCRQTDLLLAAAATGRIVNVKKGQFLSPVEMQNVTRKITETGASRILLTERGTTFGYQNLVVDMRSLSMMAALGFPVVFDATHSVQLPGAGGDRSSGQREFAPILARSAIAAGANGLFVETHPDPDHALSDGPNMIPLDEMPKLLGQWQKLHQLVNSFR